MKLTSRRTLHGKNGDNKNIVVQQNVWLYQQNVWLLRQNFWLQQQNFNLLSLILLPHQNHFFRALKRKRYQFYDEPCGVTAD